MWQPEEMGSKEDLALYRIWTAKAEEFIEKAEEYCVRRISSREEPT